MRLRLRATLQIVLFAAALMISGAEAPDLLIRQWTTEDGLPQNRVSALANTADGYLWVGGWFGVTRFDGRRFTTFNEHNTPQLKSSVVNALLATPDGSLWVGTPFGLVRRKAWSWESFSGFPKNDIMDLVADQTGEVWMALSEGFFGCLKTRQFVQLPWRAQKFAPVRKFAFTRSGAVACIGLQSVLAVSDDFKAEFAWPPEFSEKDHIRAAIQESSGAWWVALKGRIWRQDSQGHWTETLLSGSRPADADSLFRDQRGQIWANLETAGLHFFDGTFWRPFSLTSGAAAPTITCFIEDRDGHLWLGSDHGLFQLRPRLVKTFGKTEGLPSDECWSVTECEDGSVWVATAAGLGIIGGKKGRGFELRDWENGYGTRTVLSSGKEIFTGHTSFGEKISHVLLQVASDRDVKWSPVPDQLHALYEDRQKRIWGGFASGVRCWQNGHELALTNLPDSEVRFILQGSDRAMWFGSKKDGLIRWKDGVSRQFTRREGLAGDYVIALHEDDKRNLWIGTDNGLSRLSIGAIDTGAPPAFFTFTTEHGLLDNLINHILEDDRHFLWISSNRGVCRIAIAELDAVAAGTIAEAASAVFGTEDGMPASETNGEHQPAGCKTRDGRLWFPTPMGVAVFDPKLIPTRPLPPPVSIERVAASGAVVFGDGAPNSTNASPVRLSSAAAGALEIRYGANSFIRPDKLRFKYRLDGLESNWRTAGADERAALFTNLKPGGYAFHVRACDARGSWSESDAVFRFTITPVFTQTPLFPALCAAGLLSIAGALAYWRLRWQRKILLADQNAALERERARIARDLHDDLGSALTGLALEADVSRRSLGGSSEALDRIANGSRLLVDRMREVVWAINPGCDNLDGLAGFFAEHAERLLQSSGIRCRLDIPVDEISGIVLNSEPRHHLFSAYKEALHNLVKHSGASVASIALTVSHDELRIQIKDDGRGFDPGVTSGNGLRNMRERIGLAKGRLQIQSAPGKGTIVNICVPLRNNIA